jgi:hypothetical protein
MENKKIYLVVYEDEDGTNWGCKKAFFNKEEAKAYAKKLNTDDYEDYEFEFGFPGHYVHEIEMPE